MAYQGIFVLAFLSLVLSVSANDFVKTVTQNYQENINDLVTQQITKELQASYIYQAYASYFQRADVALPGTKKFFSAASLEEREHAQMLIDYINERGGNNQFHNIQLKQACDEVKKFSENESTTHSFCICHFVSSEAKSEGSCKEDLRSAEVAFHDALLVERYVNDQLLNLHKEAEEVDDAHLAHLVEHHFLDEQVKSINQLAQYVTRLRSFKEDHYKLGEYLFDQRLK